MSLDHPTQSQLDYWRQARDLRRRLYAPANAKADAGINLKRPHGIKGQEWEKLALEARRLAREAAQEKITAEQERTIKEAARLASQKEPIQDFLFVNPVRANKTPPDFYAKIKRKVAREFGVTIEQIDCKSRILRFVIPRHAAMFLAYKLTSLSLPRISFHTGNRDHTTALHAIRATPKRALKNWWLCLTVHELQCELTAEITKWRSQS